MKLRQRAATAGLALALALGAAQAPSAVLADSGEASTPTSASDLVPSEGGATVPEGYDKADFYQESTAASAVASVLSSRASLVGASDEMKYFTRYESGRNYDQGFSKWDGYHAMGYYQFDRRYSLVGVMRYCYNYDPATFGMFKPLIDRASELSSSSTVIYDSSAGRLTAIGQLAEDAWHAAYDAAPDTFAALQDTYAITNYYQPTERWLASIGVDITGRADCVKGLVWSMTNLFGTGGVKNYLRAANLSNGMSDREFVNAVVDSLRNNLSKYNSNTKYHQSWINRYEKERADCLAYIAEDESAAGGSAGGTAPQPAPPAQGEPSGDQGTVGGDSSGATDDDAADGQPSTEGGTQDGTDGGAGSEGQTSGGAGSEGTAGNDADGSEGEALPPADNSLGSGSEQEDDGTGDDSPGTGAETESEPGSEGDGTQNGVGGGDDSTTGGDAGADDVKTESEDDPAGSDEKDSGEEDSGKKAGDGSDAGTRDGSQGGSEQGSQSDASDQGTAASGNASAPTGAMPQTGDLVTMAVLASGSLTAFGVTAVKAGWIDLKHRRHDGEGE